MSATAAPSIDRYVQRAQRRASRQPPPADGGLSTTTPTGIAAFDRDAAGPEEPIHPAAGPTLDVLVEQCGPHPDNRRPSEAQVARLAESLAAEGQLEPIVVRPAPDDAATRYQIVSGETRWLAAQRLGWRTLRARVVALDDARALVMLAEHNGARHDLDPIQKARLIVRLGTAREDGGAGLTRDVAATLVGLETGAAASNLVRLLDLPAVWQDRVASGELPQTFARELLPLVAAPTLLAELDAEWAKWAKLQAKPRPNRISLTFDSRQRVALAVGELLRDVRPLDPKRTYWHTPRRGQNVVYNAYGEHRRRFELTDAARAELDVGTVVIDGEPVEIAQNAARFDALNDPLILAAWDKSAARRAARSGRDAAEQSDRPAKDSPAAKRAAAKLAAAQLAERIAVWRYRWLCHLAAARMTDFVALKLAAYVLMDQGHGLGDPAAAALDALAVEAKARVRDWHSLGRWEPFAAEASCGAIHATLVEWARAVLAAVAETTQPKHPPIPRADVAALAEELGVDVPAAWKAACGSKEGRGRIEQFLLLHQTAQLRALAEELGVDVAAATSKRDLVAAFVERAAAKPLKLPTALAARKGR